MKNTLESPSMRNLIESALGDQDAARQFTASCIELYSIDSGLKEIDAGLVAREALRAAMLKLPLSKTLGYAWVVPYNRKLKDNGREYWAKVPQFQIGWKGVVQLALRTNMYRFLNCGPVYEGVYQGEDILTGMIHLDPEKRTGDGIDGFFAYLKLTSGYEAALYWSAEKMKGHAIRYNPECRKHQTLSGVWRDNFDERGSATVLKHLISKRGFMSVDMLQAIPNADDTEIGPDQSAVDLTANSTPLVNEEEPVNEPQHKALPESQDKPTFQQQMQERESPAPAEVKAKKTTESKRKEGAVDGIPTLLH